MGKLSSLALLFLLLTSCSKRQYEQNGCTGEITITTSATNMTDVNILAPNAFTPNGDGLNDEFYLFLRGIDPNQPMNISIYKNGLNVYYSDDLFTPWNGETDGLVNKKGGYTYTFSVTTIHGEVIQGEGALTLIEYNTNWVLQNCESCIFGDMLDPRNNEVTYATQEDIGC